MFFFLGGGAAASHGTPLDPPLHQWGWGERNVIMYNKFESYDNNM